MHDLRWIRENPAEFDRGLERRGLPPCADQVLALDKEWRRLETEAQESQAERNRLSREVGAAKKRGESTDELIRSIDIRKDLEAATGAQAAELRKQIDDLLAGLPNLPAPEVPDGPDESTNKEVRRIGEPPRFNFEPLPHEAIGEKLGLMDFATAAKLSGSRFVVLKGELAWLERAIAQFMLDLHTSEFGYTEIAPPLLVRDEIAYGTGQLPKAAEDMFRTTDGLWLIPTAEVPLTNLVAGEILDEAALPLRFTAWTPCFRSEAGAAGKDTRGMIRVHQFQKVELVSITTPEQSEAEHERMTQCAEEVLKRRGLGDRVMISSCSNCGPFQALRMRARCRPAGGKGTRPVHTLNGSGLAVGRTMIAILENFQRGDGTVAIPEALQPYMHGQKAIGEHG
jgi:seryl-tRNA synthetase